jgi:hypothetical protein
MATITSSTTKVILAAPSDWREWFQLIKSSAGYARVWEYVNPDTKPEDLPVLTEPEYPTPGTIKRKAAATFAELSEKDTRNRKNSVRNIGESSNSTRRKQTLCMKSAKTSKDL